MLIREQSIADYKNGQVIPDRLTRKRHGHYIDFSGKMFDVYNNGQGKTRRELHREIENIFIDEPDCPSKRIKAFCKLLDEKSIYHTDTPSSASALRLKVFSRASEFYPLVKTPDQLFEYSEAEIKAKIAEELGVPWQQISDSLYADVIDYHRLECFEGYADPQSFLARYNIAQIQTALYSAYSMKVISTEDHKTILRHAKLSRLMHEIKRTGKSRYEIVFSGPASLLRKSSRYGIQYAKFLPALLACRGWSMEAQVRTPWNTSAVLSLSEQDGCSTHIMPPPEFDSSIEESLERQFGGIRDGWELKREGELLHNYQSVFFPDFTFYHEDGTTVMLEIVGYWRPEYLAHKREVLKQFRNNNIIIAVNEKSLSREVKSGENIITYKRSVKLKPLMQALKHFRNNC